MAHSQGDQVPVGDVAMSPDRAVITASGDHPNIVGPKLMTAKAGERRQLSDRDLWCGRHPHHVAVARYAHKPQFGHRCGGPPSRRVAAEPVPSAAMMNVVGPAERDEHVDVEKYGHSSSARALATSSAVMAGASAGTSNTGSPSTSTNPTGRSDRRARSEITAPTDRPSDRAMLRASSSTSSSICKVVRIASTVRQPGSSSVHQRPDRGQRPPAIRASAASVNTERPRSGL